MNNYLDCFAFPIAKKHVEAYQKVAQQVARIWKQHGATAYFEFVGDDLHLEGTRSFLQALQAQEDETVLFGWMAFANKDLRDKAHKLVQADPQMQKLVAPLMDPEHPIFDARRMVYGGFSPLLGNNF